MATKHIPDEIINDIRYQTDIVQVISEYVSLERTGKNYKGLCPFHREKTPSFVVSSEKQIFHCYGCGAGGNVFTFLMQYEKYSFPEAVRVLAQRLGIQLPEAKQAQPSGQLQRLEKLLQLHREAAQYFSRQLTQSGQGKQVREYLTHRGIDEKAIQTFSLGYASPVWDGLRNALIRKYPVDLLLESGLLIKKKRGVGQYDRFRDRLIIPIHDDRGRIIAFGGRILGQGEPKYLNSPESPIFHKSRTLFGLHYAKDAIRRMGYIVIVEGYFDMIVPYIHGINNVVATMGTALTEQHLRLIQRYTKKVVLVFDSDPAGIKAVLRTLDLFLMSGFEARAVVLPKGDDPDSAIRKGGAERFLKYIEQAPFLLDFVRERIVERYDLSRIDHQIACANQILPTIIKIRDIVERNIQINKTADILRVSDQALLQEFKKISETGKIQFRQEIPQKRTVIPRLEQYLIKSLIKDKSLISHVKTELDPTELSHPVSQKVLEALFIYGDKTDFEAKILDLFSGASVQNELTELFLRADDVVDPQRTVQDCIYRLRQQSFEHDTRDITRKVRDAQERDKDEILNSFLEQKNRDLMKKRLNSL